MLVEYIWLDIDGIPRSKTKVIYDKKPEKMEDLKLPFWNFDGSSTEQASGVDSELVLKPQTVCLDPFRGGDSLMVLCDVYKYSNDGDFVPHATNTRYNAAKLFESHASQKSLFGIEQEFFLMKGEDNLAISHNEGKKMKPQGDYYCGNGSNNAIGRDCVEAAFKRCIIAGIRVTGMNAEVAPAQWEIQVSANGIAASDQLHLMRYIMNRTAEMYGLWINYHPKPLGDNWNGSGCHVNFSTEEMRGKDGIEFINVACKGLEQNHDKHIIQYGDNNELRLTGEYETSSFNKFTWGVGDRTASVRVTNETLHNKCGYLEDRRPSSNMDPYVVTSLILETCLSSLKKIQL